jgi:hypothetical protein
MFALAGEWLSGRGVGDSRSRTRCGTTGSRWQSDDPAGQRQVGLAEAAAGPRGARGAASGLTAEPGAAFAGVDQQAGGVNDSTKEQAAAVQLQRAPSVAPEQVLPSAGQVNGCETADAAKSFRSRGADRRVLDLH